MRGLKGGEGSGGRALAVMGGAVQTLEVGAGWDQGRGSWGSKCRDSARVPYGVLLTCCQERRGVFLRKSWGQALVGQGGRSSSGET